MNKSTRTIIKTIFFGVLLTIFNSACGQTKAEKIDDLLRKYEEYGKLNGSVLVSENGKIIYKKGFGFANVEWAVPNQPNTKHRLASITKQFTAMLIVQMAAENKLKLDVPISTYLPDYPKKTGDIITIHNLLTHTSGIPNYTDFPDFRDQMRIPHRPEEIVKLFADSTLDFTPGEKFQYSNSGYILLGYIIEKLNGKSYEEVLKTKIFEPLKMNNSGCDQALATIKNKASGYNKVGNTFENAMYIDMSFPFSAGGIYSTVEDLYLWDQALYTEKLAPKKFMDLLFNKYIQTSETGYYGYGWELASMPIGSTSEQTETINHSGGINGFNTLITRFPTDKSLVVILNNTSSAPLEEITIAINGILHSKPYALPKKSMAITLLDVMEKKGIDAALIKYKEIKNSPDATLIESEMNLAGYELLHTNKAKKAAAIFKINVEAFPNSFNVYDSYGEGLIAVGDKKGAIDNYMKSIKLNPGNTNGLIKLKDLGVNTDGLIPKVPLEDLKLLEGEYLVTNPSTERDKTWKIVFKVEKGELKGNDRGYHYRLVPVGPNEFINPDDGASLVFDSKDKNAITLMLFGKYKFKKLN